MFVLTKYAIPYLSNRTGQETILFWFIVAGVGIFTPLIVTGVLMLNSEGYKLSKSTITERLRFRKLTKQDVLWSIGGLILVMAISGGLMTVIELVVGKMDTSPSFMAFEPLSQGRYWLLAIWAPY